MPPSRYLLVCLALLLGACDDEDTCAKQLTVNATFWDVTCWTATIKCNGEPITPEGWEEGTSRGICDIGPFSCDEPGVYTYNYTLLVGSLHKCEYCSTSDDKDFCVPLSNECGLETIDIVASGSAQAGAHPMTCCPDDPDCI